MPHVNYTENARFIRQTFSQDLFEEFSRRQSLTDEDLTTDKKLRALALELAADHKYKGYLKYLEFSDTWLFEFRKKFRMNGGKQIDEYVNPNELKELKETFSQDLYDEMTRRQSLTEENLANYENLRVLALELAADPKYKGYLSTYKFGRTWICAFRKKFNICLETAYFHAKNNFTEELFEEASRRHSLNDENSFSYKNLRALALELARKDTYKKYMGNCVFNNSWLKEFRKKFHIGRNKKEISS